MHIFDFFRDIFSVFGAFSRFLGVKFGFRKSCLCKRNDKYEVCICAVSFTGLAEQGGRRKALCGIPCFCFPVHYVQFVKYDDTVSFMAQVLDTVTYLVPQVLDTASSSNCLVRFY